MSFNTKLNMNVTTRLWLIPGFPKILLIWGDFKICGDKLILDILVLQMKKRSQGAIAFLNALKEAILKKSLGNPGLKKVP